MTTPKEPEGAEPGDLARRIAEQIEQRYDYTGTVKDEVLELAELIDREIAKAGAFIPAETLDKVELALEKFAVCSHDEHDEWRAICPRHAARLALESLRSERKPL